METVSVIIPAYNSKETIERCLNSIVGQTYKNLEIIVVNDGSTDETSTIVADYLKNDNRISLINTTNNGVSHARNVGIDYSHGEYITFVDSDDTIEEWMYEYLLQLAKEKKAEISHCSYNNCSDNGIISVVGNNGIILEQTKEEAINCLLLGQYFSGGLWNKLFLKELFDNVRLDENIRINEDVLLCFELFSKAKKIVFSDKPLYNYYATINSSTHKNTYLDKAKQMNIVSEKIFQMSIGESYENAALKKLAITSLNLYECLVCANANKKEIFSIKQKVVDYYKKKLYKRKAEKLKIYILRFFPLLYRRLFKIYDKKRQFKLDPTQ